MLLTIPSDLRKEGTNKTAKQVPDKFGNDAAAEKVVVIMAKMGSYRGAS